LSAAQAEKGNVNMSLINTELSQVKDLFDNLNVDYINYFPENKTEREILFCKISGWKLLQDMTLFKMKRPLHGGAGIKKAISF
jgi:hypothetical protein